MIILMKLAIMAGWFLLVVSISVATWSGIIWLLNRNYIGGKGASAILLIVLFCAIWLCTKYK